MPREPEPSVPRPDPANAEQLRAWDGPTGAYWAQNAERYDAGVADYRPHFVAACAIGGSDAVLDIGCGAGQTTRDAARAASGGSALGVDLSAQLLGIARAAAEREGLANVAFRQADAQTHPFPAGTVDVVISRTGVMFFADPDAAFANLAGALRPDGRLVLMTWQPIERQEWLRTYFATLAAGRDIAPPPSGAPGPMALDDPDRIRRILTGAGFTDIAVDGVEGRMYAGPDADDATRFVCGQHAGLLEGLDGPQRSRAIGELHAAVDAHRDADGVHFDSAVWIVRARRA